MKHELILKQKQKLILTPQLYQSINILQLNIVELRNVINQELIENPLLEIAQPKKIETESDQREYENDNDVEDKNVPQEKINLIDCLSYLKEKEYVAHSSKQHDYRKDGLERILSYRISLQDYLLNQLRLTTKNALDYKIGEYIIGNIDENGYLKLSLEIVSKEINIEEDRIYKILQLIQSFDPPGVGARSLEECLLIQEKQLEYHDINLQEIIKKYLPDLANKSYQRIAKELDLSVTEIQKLADAIKKNFDPKPGRKMSSLNEIKYTIPDLVIRKKTNGEYRIIQNDTFLPRIKINHMYKNILDRGNDSVFLHEKRLSDQRKNIDRKIKDTKEYIENKINSAKYLINGIEHRKQTINRIIETLIDYQRDFLDKGILFIKPLTLKDVADRLNIHESTVSRAIHGKYIQTPRGLVKIKFFFSKRIEDNNTESISATKIKKMIKTLIQTENHCQPWSDQKIADLLYLKENINIARRTVTKYRKTLKILPSKFRKRFNM